MIWWLSDLHLGDGSQSDDFVHDELMLEIIEIIDPQIVLLGDVFDLWKYRTGAIFQAHTRLICEIFSRTEMYVVGNHDARMMKIGTAGPQFGLPPIPMGEGAVITLSNGKRVWTEHGHCYDQYMSNLPGISRIGTRICEVIEHVIPDFNSKSQDIIHRLFMTGRYANKKSNKNSYDYQVAKTAHENDCSVAIYGHLHELGVKKIKIEGREILLGNAGCWMDGEKGGIIFGKQIP